MRAIILAAAILCLGGPAKADTWLVAKAERYVGMTAQQVGVRRTLWCAAFINKLLPNGGTKSDMAFSFKKYGTPARKGCIGCVAVSTRKGGGHVGIVKGYASNGNPITINGNGRGRRVSVHQIPASRVVAYRHVSGGATRLSSLPGMVQ